MFTKIFCRFPAIFIEKTTFKEFEEIYEQICKQKQIQNSDEKEIIDSNIDLLRNMFLNI